MGHFAVQISTRVFSVDEVLSPYVYVFYISFIVSFLFTPIMRAVAIYYNIVDQPDRLRKMHQMPVAYLGGVAVFLGWISGLAITQFLSIHRQEAGWNIGHPSIKFSIVLGALIIIVLGLWDDLHGVKPIGKICGQVAAAIFLLMDDVGTQCARPLIAPIYYRLDGFLGGTLGDPMLTSWFMPTVYVCSATLVVTIVVFCCNATNLMDGLDGLC